MSGEDVNPILDEAYESLNEILEEKEDVDSDLTEELERTRNAIEDVINRADRLETRNEEYQDALDTVLTDFEDMTRSEIEEREEIYEELRNFRHDLEDIADEKADTDDAVAELDSQRHRDYERDDGYKRSVNQGVYEDQETDRRGFGKSLVAVLAGGALVSIGAIGQEILEEQEDSNGSAQPPGTPEDPSDEPTGGEPSDDTPEETPEEDTVFNLSNLAGRELLAENSYEALEEDYGDIGEIIEDYKTRNRLNQFGNNLEEKWLENSATSLNLGLSSVKVQETAQGSRLVYEEDNPDGYIGQLWDFDNDIKASYVFEPEDVYDEAIEVMEAYN